MSNSDLYELLLPQFLFALQVFEAHAQRVGVSTGAFPLGTFCLDAHAQGQRQQHNIRGGAQLQAMPGQEIVGVAAELAQQKDERAAEHAAVRQAVQSRRNKATAPTAHAGDKQRRRRDGTQRHRSPVVQLAKYKQRRKRMGEAQHGDDGHGRVQTAGVCDAQKITREQLQKAHTHADRKDQAVGLPLRRAWPQVRVTRAVQRHNQQ